MPQLESYARWNGRRAWWNRPARTVGQAGDRAALALLRAERAEQPGRDQWRATALRLALDGVARFGREAFELAFRRLAYFQYRLPAEAVANLLAALDAAEA